MRHPKSTHGLERAKRELAKIYAAQERTSPIEPGAMIQPSLQISPIRILRCY